MSTFTIPEGLMARCAGQSEICRRVVQKYVQQMTDDVETLSVLLKEVSDSKSAALLAHRMKGASLNVEAVKLHQIAATIEKLAEDDRMEEASTHLEQLRDSWAEYLELTHGYVSEPQCAS